MNFTRVARLSALGDRQPLGVSLAGQDLIVIRAGDSVSVLDGRCPHRGARLANARVEGDLLVCGVHGWSFSCRDGSSPASPSDQLKHFTVRIDGAADAVLVDEDQVRGWADSRPEPFDPDELMLDG